MAYNGSYFRCGDKKNWLERNANYISISIGVILILAVALAVFSAGNGAGRNGETALKAEEGSGEEGTVNHEENVHRNCSKPGLFALTFDDGPSVGRTEEILDVLKLNNVKATFFVCGQTYGNLNSADSQELLKRIVEEGHQLGVHTWNHPHLSDRWRHAPEIREEVRSVAEKIYEITGITATVMRPPYGAYNTTIVDIVYGEFGLDVVLWNISTKDFNHPGDTATGMKHYVEGTANTNPDSHSFIALHHDPLHGSAELAQQAINFMKKLNYTFVTVNECLGK